MQRTLVHVLQEVRSQWIILKDRPICILSPECRVEEYALTKGGLELTRGQPMIEVDCRRSGCSASGRQYHMNVEVESNQG